MDLRTAYRPTDLDSLAVDNLGGAALTTYLAANHLAFNLSGNSFNYLSLKLTICK